MYKVTEFHYDLGALNGGLPEVLVTGVRPYYEFIDGKASKNVLGFAYETIFVGHNFDRLFVKIPGTKPLITEEMLAQNHNSIRVSYIGFDAKFYYNQREHSYLLTATATDLEVISNDK